MNPDNRGVDHLDGRIVSTRKRFHDPSPNARPSPANEAVVASSVWPESIGQITPRCSGSQHPKDAIQYTAVIRASHAARLVRQHWPDDSPLIVGEFIAHDSGSSLGA